mmetsp:Transcript_18725/g.36075  ORF Transcript_18725/g.36075 Transcript_18725/m.36075 type:complete len:991 (-) Transcript_18725:174-3146(-)
MGSALSSFQTAMVNGDEATAVKYYRTNDQIKQLDPNEEIKHRSAEGNTLLQLACKHAMAELVYSLLAFAGGGYADVCKVNTNGENCGHLLLSSSKQKEQRLLLLKDLVEYKGSNGRLNVSVKDKQNNTLLHVASKNGLEDCCMYLINRGMGVYLAEENKAGLTPAALAEESKHIPLAAKMEAMIVYPIEVEEVEARTTGLLMEIKEEDEAYQTHRGMRLQDIRSMKDNMVMSMVNFLYGNDISNHNLFKAECLLLAYQWNPSTLQHEWLTNAKQACMKAGIEPPDSKGSRLEPESNKVCLTCGGDGADDEDEDDGGDVASGQVAELELSDPLEKRVYEMIKQNRNIGDMLRTLHPEYTKGRILKANQKLQAMVMTPQSNSNNVPKKKQGPPPITDPLMKKLVAYVQQGKTMAQVLPSLRSQGHNPATVMRTFQKAQTYVNASADEGSDQKHKKSKKPAELISVKGCGHAFCKTCWRGYLKVKIADGEVQTIICPQFKCNHRVPASIIDYPLVDRKTAQRYMKFELRDFVKENKDICWCPAPGCDAAVARDADVKEPTDPKFKLPSTADCGEGHFFCFECKGEPHDPCTCEEWKRWNIDCEAMSKQLGTANANAEDAAAYATMLWLQTNTKRCPRCKNGIEKNEGCNHMTCRGCRHEFCWICMAPWSTHGQKTGGYYKCNVYKGSGPTDNKGESAAAQKKKQESERFIHFIERIKAHQDSKKLEQKMVNTAKQRVKEMQTATPDRFVDTSFVHIAFRELYWNRIVLCASYIRQYYATANDKPSPKPSPFLSKYKRGGKSTGELPPEFATLQAALESSTEALSNAIARKRWKTPRRRVVTLAHSAQQARNRFLDKMMWGGRRREKKKSTQEKKVPKSESVVDAGPWECTRCTFLNTSGKATECSVCGTERPKNVRAKRPSVTQRSRTTVPAAFPSVFSIKPEAKRQIASKDYSDELARMRDMGLGDSSKNLAALYAADGDVARAVDRVLMQS